MKTLKTLKYKFQIIRNRPNFSKGFVFVLGFAIVGATLLIISRASTPTADFESESSALSGAAKLISDTNASGGQAVQFGQVGAPPPSVIFPVHPGVVYTKADTLAWTTSDPDYTALVSSPGGSLTRTVWSFGSDAVINSGGNPNCTNCDLNTGYKDQSGFAKVQAVLWTADQNTAHRDKVTAYLNEYRSLGSSTNAIPWEYDTTEQYRLVSGWACTNLAQAAELTDYQDADFKAFLRKCYDIMDWTANPNWHASFADSKLAIAAYLGDAALWTDAKAYFYERIKQSIYLTSDGNKPFPMHSEDNGSAKRLHSGAGTPNAGATQRHWGKDIDDLGDGQLNADMTFNTTRFGPPVNGMNAERVRDLGHVNMGLDGWVHGARTIRAQGEQLQQDAIDRLYAAWGYHAPRVLAYEKTGVVPSPTTLDCTALANCNGGDSRYFGYYGAMKLFSGLGLATPQSINDMINYSTTQTFYAKTSSAGGYNHTVAEKFADGS